VKGWIIGDPSSCEQVPFAGRPQPFLDPKCGGIPAHPGGALVPPFPAQHHEHLDGQRANRSRPMARWKGNGVNGDAVGNIF